MRNEIWRPIIGLEGSYEASNLGRIRSLDRVRECVSKKTGEISFRKFSGRIIIPNANRSGHMTVCLPPLNGVKRKSKSNIRTYVHRLVLEAFVGPAPEGLIGCHINGDPANNALTNLEWGTRSRNLKDFWEHRNAAEVAALRAEIAALEHRLSLCKCGLQ